MSEDAVWRMSLHVAFAMIQMQCQEFCIRAHDKADDVFGLSLQCLESLQTTYEINVRISAPKAKGVEQSTKTCVLENHEMEPTDGAVASDTN